MKITDAYLRNQTGEIQRTLVRTESRSYGEVTAVFIDGIVKNDIGKADGKELDCEFGAGIDFELENSVRWMSDFRHSEFWCRPEFGTCPADIPDETQGLVWQKADGSFGVILPVVSEQYKCVLRGKNEKEVTAKLFSWYDHLTCCRALAFLCAEGTNPQALFEKCAKAGLELLGTGYRIRKERRYPEIFEYLGWCSWDAMEIRVNEEDLLRKCEEFREKQIPVKWSMIDDMWAEVHDFYDRTYQTRGEMFSLMHSSRLYSFHADPIRFPNGLKHCIDRIREYGIKVGMWHPTTGYWMGIDPRGEICRDHRDCLMQTESGVIVPDYKREKAWGFYNAFHDYLRKCGAELIKIDNQSMTRRFYKKHAPVGEIAREFHDGMEASVGFHFDNNMINCMGMASEDMWNRSVSPLSRCSDDFQPENSDWFTKHILQCAYNCLVQGSFYYCDWDMWWTDDGQAVKNSVLRAVSGGPIYVSDQLGRSRREVLMPLVLEDGRILRCDRPAVPTADCLMVNPVDSGRIFKVQNICGDSGVIAAFNLDEQDRPVTGQISPRDVEGLEGEEFAVYEHFSKECHILKAGETLELKLEDRGQFRLYVVVPIRDGFAAIGRTDKMISPKTVKAVKGREVFLVEEGPYAVVEDGKLVFR